MIERTRSTLFTQAAAAGPFAVIPGAALGGSGSTANTTIFGPNACVFDTSMPAADIQSTAAGIFSKMDK